MEVDLHQLRVVGARGVGVAFLGSLLPLGIGTGIAYGIFSLPIRESLAVGASLAPTSMGISLKVLAEGKVLNTPIGQLIIAAAVIDDVIALVLLSELEALENPTLANFLVPIASSLAFIFGVGSLAVFVVPRLLKRFLQRVPELYMPPLLLGGTLLTAYALLPATHYAKSSYLLGAFLGGLCFCTAEPLMPVWHNNAYQVLSWLLRVFFACTLGFEVPIRSLWTPPILIQTAAYLLGFFGKFVTGVFGTPRTLRNFSVIGFAMSAWGEFAFVVATTSREMGTMGPDSFGAVVLAVLLSAFYSPLAVQLTLSLRSGGLRRALPCAATGAAKADEGVLHRVYYRGAFNIPSRWGLTDRLLRGIHDLGLDIVEFRIHSTDAEWSRFLVFLRDRELRAPSALELGPVKDTAAERARELRLKLAEKLGIDLAEVAEEAPLAEGADALVLTLERWVPDLDDQHPDQDDRLAFQQARDACSPTEPAQQPPKTLGGLVRRSMGPRAAGPNALRSASLARQSTGPSQGRAALARQSMGAGRLARESMGPLGRGPLAQQSVGPLAGLSRNSLEGAAPGKRFTLARVSGAPIFPTERPSPRPADWWGEQANPLREEHGPEENGDQDGNY